MNRKTAGFIGLGNMGGGMAHNLLKAVDQLYVHDMRPESMESLQQAGAIPCANPAEIASNTSTLFLCLPYAPEVRQALFGVDGVKQSGREDTVVIDTTTLDRDDAINIGAEAAGFSIAYHDAPVSGLPRRARDGTLKVMFGGSEESFLQVRQYLDCFGEAMHCGSLGSGQAMKAINNIIYNINIVALCEVLPLAVAVGLKPEQLAEVVTSGSSRSFASEHFVPRMLEGQFNNDFLLRDAYKDIVNVQKMAIDTQASTPVVNAMITTYQAAMAAGYESEPKSAMLKVYEKLLNVEFRQSV